MITAERSRSRAGAFAVASPARTLARPTPRALLRIRTTFRRALRHPLFVDSRRMPAHLRLTRKMRLRGLRAGPGPSYVDTADKHLYLVREGGAPFATGHRRGAGRASPVGHGRRVGRKRRWGRAGTPPPPCAAVRPAIAAPQLECAPRQPARPPARSTSSRAAGDTLYRIHGTNEPWSIGESVSSGWHPQCSTRRTLHLYEKHQGRRHGWKVQERHRLLRRRPAEPAASEAMSRRGVAGGCSERGGPPPNPPLRPRPLPPPMVRRKRETRPGFQNAENTTPHFATTSELRADHSYRGRGVLCIAGRSRPSIHPTTSSTWGGGRDHLPHIARRCSAIAASLTTQQCRTPPECLWTGGALDIAAARPAPRR